MFFVAADSIWLCGLAYLEVFPLPHYRGCGKDSCTTTIKATKGEPVRITLLRSDCHVASVVAIGKHFTLIIGDTVRNTNPARTTRRIDLTHGNLVSCIKSTGGRKSESYSDDHMSDRMDRLDARENRCAVGGNPEYWEVEM